MSDIPSKSTTETLNVVLCALVDDWKFRIADCISGTFVNFRAHFLCPNVNCNVGLWINARDCPCTPLQGSASLISTDPNQ